MKLYFLRWFYFIWVIIPIALWLVYLMFGTPHVLWSYSWNEYGQDERYYSRCTYIGYTTSYTVRANQGKCDFIRFFKEKEEDKG